MKTLIFILLTLSIGDQRSSVGEINTIKQNGIEAYLNKDYKEAIKQFIFLTDSLKIDEDEVFLNLSQAYLKLEDWENSQTAATKALNSSNLQYVSKAHELIANAAYLQEKYEDALASYKDALIANPYNKNARHNYEATKKLLDQNQNEKNQEKEDKEGEDKEQEENKDENKKEENKDSEEKDEDKSSEESSEDKGEESEKSKDKGEEDGKEEGEEEGTEPKQESNNEEKGDDSEEPVESSEESPKEHKNKDEALQQRLKEMNISEEQAQMLLNAMRNKEIQYIQQQPKKGTKNPNRNDPDW